MSQTIPDLIITQVWQSINTLSGIAVGTSMIVDNKSTPTIILAEGTQPLADSRDGIPLTNFINTQSARLVESGSLEIWARVPAKEGTATMAVQER